MIRLIAFLDRARLTEPTLHFEGLPEELNPGGTRRPMPHPDVLLLQEEQHGAMVYRYTAEGGFGGDTWDESVDGAQWQATTEYGDALGEWTPVPDEVGDAHEYAIAAARSRDIADPS